MHVLCDPISMGAHIKEKLTFVKPLGIVIEAKELEEQKFIARSCIELFVLGQITRIHPEMQSVGKCGKQPCDTSGLANARTCILRSPS